ncbi:MAG: glycosyltransferase WbuB [Herpetosiphonaceae bacterium]|nr:MAG: glycosyltransferase WbuB [Herpetosiphonaceae bacterium]
MRILYIASGIRLPGTHGGSTHTLEVARGLAQRGHEVHVVARPPGGARSGLARSIDGFTLHYLNLPKALALPGYPAVRTLVRRLQPDALMERYYNFAGAGVLAAHKAGIPVLLEVNALIVDPPAILKRRLDDRLGGPMRRWAVQQCRWSARIVTPLHTTVPPEIEREKIVELPWGANVERFQAAPAERQRLRAAIRARYAIDPAQPVLIFLGSFRAWHGVATAVRAAIRLLGAGHDLHLLLVGDGPERAAVEALARGWEGRVTCVGSVPHEEVPGYLYAADIGVAPFDRAGHLALQAAGFFWSPLKVYEYMAAGLPVVTAAIPPLDQAIRPGIEGLLFREGSVESLAAAVAQLLRYPDEARAMGERARIRVAAHYSWQRHCEELERILREIRG